ncbi:SCO family protein [soil metagenome]
MRAAAVVLALLFGLGCKRHDAPPGPSASAVPSVAPSPVPAGESIYVLGTRLVDQDDAKVRFDVFRGHPVLVAMFYATCPAACPTLTRDLQHIEERLTSEQRADLRVLMISFDPERDTPAKLRGLVDKYKVDTTRWKFATSSEKSVREIAAVLGVQYRKIDDGEFAHSTKIVLLDREGAIAAQLEGLRQPSDELVATLQSLPKAP